MTPLLLLPPPTSSAEEAPKGFALWTPYFVLACLFAVGGLLRAGHAFVLTDKASSRLPFRASSLVRGRREGLGVARFCPPGQSFSGCYVSTKTQACLHGCRWLHRTLFLNLTALPRGLRGLCPLDIRFRACSIGGGRRVIRLGHAFVLTDKALTSLELTLPPVAPQRGKKIKTAGARAAGGVRMIIRISAPNRPVRSLSWRASPPPGTLSCRPAASAPDR
ncbi:hypothetical protein BCM02_101847 [Paenibacillus methanolicus]|uniref:Uncharacterized protein n=1 Tax=Paenibacillus methanolicus TaxID=582686 RepID=A0A5S5CIU9_9BACL|nr:hypothetical protein BCM02_101847 [Paenibacillus methanolicus]